MSSNHRSFPHGTTLTFLYKRNISLEKTARSFNLWHIQTRYVIFLLKQTKKIACNSLALLRIADDIRLLRIWEKKTSTHLESVKTKYCSWGAAKGVEYFTSNITTEQITFSDTKTKLINYYRKKIQKFSTLPNQFLRHKLFWRRSEWAHSSFISYLKYFSCVSYLDSDIRSFKCWIRTCWRRFCKINIDIFTIFDIWLSQDCRIPFRTPISNS